MEPRTLWRDLRRPGEVSWLWVPAHLAAAWHGQLIDRFGGAPGIRDLGLLEGALARPRTTAGYQPEASVERLAAIYGVGLAKGHAFVDGNKRVAFAVMVAFLKANGRSLDATEAAAAALMVGVAAGSVGEAELERWITESCRRE